MAHPVHATQLSCTSGGPAPRPTGRTGSLAVVTR